MLAIRTLGYRRIGLEVPCSKII